MRACHAQHSCHEWRKGLKHCWYFVSLKSILNKLGQAFLCQKKRIVGKQLNWFGPKWDVWRVFAQRSKGYVWFKPYRQHQFCCWKRHSNEVGGATAYGVRILGPVSLAQKPSHFQTEKIVQKNQLCKRSKVGGLYKSRPHLRDLLQKIAKARPFRVSRRAYQSHFLDCFYCHRKCLKIFGFWELLGLEGAMKQRSLAGQSWDRPENWPPLISVTELCTARKSK